MTRNIPIAASILLLLFVGVLTACERQGRPFAAAKEPVSLPEMKLDLAPVAVRSDAHISRLMPGGPVVVDGATVFSNVCAACHQANGQGIANVFPPLDNSEYVTGDVDRLISIIVYGLQGPITVNGVEYNNVMAPLARLSNEEIAAVATYVRNSWSNDTGDEVSEEAVQAIRDKYGSRGMFNITELGAES